MCFPVKFSSIREDGWLLRVPFVPQVKVPLPALAFMASFETKFFESGGAESLH